MTDKKLLQEYVRVRLTPMRIMIEVRVSAPDTEDGQPTPARWSLAAALPKLSPPTAVERARQMVVADRRYFRTCDACGEKRPSAWIVGGPDGREICITCPPE
jgi:hypothetical protein